MQRRNGRNYLFLKYRTWHVPFHSVCWAISSLEALFLCVLSFLPMPHAVRHLSKAFLLSCNYMLIKNLMVSPFYKINSKLLDTLMALCPLALFIFSDLISHSHTHYPLFQPHWTLHALLNKPCIPLLVYFSSDNFLGLKCTFQLFPS